MIDTETRPEGKRAPKRQAKSVAPTSPPGKRYAVLTVLVALTASVILVGGAVAAFIWWPPITDAALQVWDALRYTLIALGAWAAAAMLTLWRRPNLIGRYPHFWASSLLLVPVVAGGLQLSGPHLGGAFGEWLIGPSAAWGIVRAALLFTAAVAVAAPAQAYYAAKVAVLALGFVLMHVLSALHRVLKWAQTAGVWIGLKCTEASPRLCRAVAAVWRGIGRVYGKLPVHVYVIGVFIIIGSFVLRRPSRGPRRTRPYASQLEGAVYPYTPGLFEDVGPYSEPVLVKPAQPQQPYQPPTWMSAARAPSAAPSPAAQTEETDDGGQVVPIAVDDSYESSAEEDGIEDDGAPFDLDDDEPAEDDDFAGFTEPAVIDLRSTEARSGGHIAQTSTKWDLPPLDLLKSVPLREISEEVHQATARLIEQTLAEYGIEVGVKEIRPGPVVTQYGVVPGWVRRYKDVKEHNPDGTPARGADGKLVSRRVEQKTRVRVDHILAREKDLALALAASSLRFEGPVPGESFMGLEVPNAQREVVTLRSSLESSAFEAFQKKAKLPVAIGLGSGGEPIIIDLVDMPHLLIAGTTGSGKSVCMNTIICSLLMQRTPLDLQMYLVDPKRVELTAYSALPHLAGPVLVEADQAVPALQALVAEQQSRYKRFEARSARNIESYNAKLSKGEEKLPYLILIIDELAELMMTASSAEVEQGLCRLAQLGRAAGIHLVVATQRPSVNVVTGLIKANFPSRISFAVSSNVDSRTVLDSVGAEKLLGRGDLLFMSTSTIKPKRLQGAFISDEEVDAIVSFWNKQKGKPKPSVQVEIASPDSEEDTMLLEAQRLALHHQRISASLLQRKLGVGYAKAASLLDHLEDKGIVGPGDPGKSREVITPG